MGATSPPPRLGYSLLLFWSEYTEYLKGCWCNVYLEYSDWFLGELCRSSQCPYKMPCYEELQQPGRALCQKGAFVIIFSTSASIDRPTAAELLRHKFFTKAKVRKHLLICSVQRLWRGLVRSMMGMVTALLASAWAVSLGASIAEWVEWVVVNKQNETPLLYLLVYAAIKRNYLEILEHLNVFQWLLGFFSSLLMVPCWLRVQP